MVGGDLELRGFYGNIMSICRLGNHEVSMETTRFPKKYASSRAGLRFPIGIHPSTRGNCSFVCGNLVTKPIFGACYDRVFS